MARILLSAYACEPERGSEPGVGWNWATELARLGHHVTVITRAANRLAIESGARPPSENLFFVYYDLPQYFQRWRKYALAKALYYVLWQWFAARHIRKSFPALPFDLVHHITYVSIRYPSFMGSLDIPFWFGPVSGGETVPARLRPGFSAGQCCRECLRDLSNRLVRLDPLMRHTFKQAQHILVTRDTLNLLPKRFRRRSRVRLAVGLSEYQMPRTIAPPRHGTRDLHLLFVGRLLDWKGADLALLAFSRVQQAHPNIRFTIVGQGAARPRLERLSRRLGLRDFVHWVGWQPQRILDGYYRTSDLLVFPSLRDSGGMVVLEAMAHGVPVICTDLGGPGVIVNSSCGRVIQTKGRGREQLIQDMVHALTELITVPNLLESLSYGTRVRAREFKFTDLVQSIYTDLPTGEAGREA